MGKALGIILAAGRGSRMKGFTDAKPKCLLELAGKPLLQWQMEALCKGGIEDICIVCGYKASMLQANALPWMHSQTLAGIHSLQSIENNDWETSTMLRTLLCADGAITKAFASGVSEIIVSYSDIVYHYSHIAALRKGEYPLCISFDTQWEQLWRLRFSDPLSDAESFVHKDGILCDIGHKALQIQDIMGQYMGLLRFTCTGWKMMQKVCATLEQEINTIDMTSFLQILVHQGHTIGVIGVDGQWCEADNQEDLHKYSGMLQDKHWSHDWRW